MRSIYCWFIVNENFRKKIEILIQLETENNHGKLCFSKITHSFLMQWLKISSSMTENRLTKTDYDLHHFLGYTDLNKKKKLYDEFSILVTF